ncbi:MULTISPECIES: hypothetical protein [unclassified Synechocystis]|uniref:hypothetical protein n=1 Tax=unclassified Synechocystis TaxID=2640012 RepID=UPI00059D975B|nr:MULTISPECIES: hypothetical protein [unclassified Synechocystis]ALJ66538.1 hypothetical protein AOY38_00960 [Synechocystis sp. PCC 6803]AVP88382.1 hypothetical protein C7I86_00975 [Synechocystis sp. IPPAS B-1465]QWO80744.1 hypothetical protein KBZ93_00980 [Synechocystis sp. PCC 6803]UOO11870.1 hypothetical protein MT986_00980 [Synechocystis sp. PCC 6803]
MAANFLVHVWELDQTGAVQNAAIRPYQIPRFPKVPRTEFFCLNKRVMANSNQTKKAAFAVKLLPRPL